MMTSEDIARVKRGPADLEERIEQLLKQKELLKSACKKAGARIEELERDREILKKEIDRLSEENENLRIMMKK
jgi:chromosome segregation ATPase